MNVEIGTEAAQFPEKEYINGIFVVVYFRLTIEIEGHREGERDRNREFEGGRELYVSAHRKNVATSSIRIMVLLGRIFLPKKTRHKKQEVLHTHVICSYCRYSIHMH
jgi:hypothetical protein